MLGGVWLCCIVGWGRGVWAVGFAGVCVERGSCSGLFGEGGGVCFNCCGGVSLWCSLCVCVCSVFDFFFVALCFVALVCFYSLLSSMSFLDEELFFV